jgi:hypothetical protein
VTAARAYRKKPVEVQAMHLADTMKSATEVADWCGGHYSPDSNPDGSDPMHFVVIRTLEGDMLASPGDWIIRGVKGEFYPCKPDIFEATYEPVE